MDTAAAVTTYAVFQNSTPRRVEITQPDGTESIQYSHNSPGSYLDGLVYNDETRDSAGALLQSSTVTWQQGAYNSPRPTRIDITDERGQLRRAEFTYGTVYNQVTEVRDYDYGGTALLRKTVTAYENGASYTNNHIFNLPKKVEVFASDGATRVSQTEYLYDSEGRVSERKLTLDSRPSHPFTTNYGYDSLNRVATVTYQQQYPSTTRKAVTHSYDAASRPSGLQVGGVAYASNIVYNAASQVTSIDVGTGVGNWKQEQYTYGAATGLLINQKVLRAGDAAQELLDLSYDYLRPGTTAGRTGQLTKVTNHLDAAENRTYEYDALGRLRRATGGADGRWTQRYEYDRYGNRRNVYSKPVEQFVRDFYQGALARQPNSTELQTWTDGLRLAYPQGQGPLLTEAKDLGRALFQSAEYAARNRTDRDFVADLYRGYLQRAPDQAGWDYWTGVVATAGREAVRQSFEGSGEFDYGVNGLSPLAPASGVGVPRDGLAGPVFFDAATNRINSAGWQYDAAGNQTRVWDGAAWQRMEYDMAGRLVRAEQDNGVLIASYTYGSSTARLVAHEGGTRTYYAWGAGGTISEYTETDGATADTTPQWGKGYVYLGNRLLATQRPGGAAEVVEYHHPDRLGTRLVSNAADAGSFEQAALPFGTELAAESTGATGRRFTSYERSQTTDLDYAVNRHYDPRQGRFTTVDPIGMSAADLAHPQTLNLYAYCANDPVNRTDPDGLFFGWLKRLFKRILNALVKAVVVAVFTFIKTGGNLPAALAAGGAAFLKEFGWPTKIGVGATPPTFARPPTLQEIVQASPIGRFIYGDPRYARTPGYNPYASNFAAQSPSLLDKLKGCVKTLYNIDLKSFKFATKRRNGVFVGFGFDFYQQKATEIVVTTDASSYDSRQLFIFYETFRRKHPGFAPLAIGGRPGGLTLPPGMVGFGNSPGILFTPYLNYLAKDGVSGSLRQRVHIHELGHALTYISFGEPRSTEDGRPLEECVYGNVQ